MLWASPSLTRHDVQSKRPSSIFFMEVRATVNCCSSARVLEKWDLLTIFGRRKFCFWHRLSLKLWTAIAEGQRICTEAVSVWLLLSDEPRTTSMCWQHLGMKLTSVTWHWRKHMHQVRLEISMNVIDFVETLKPKSIHSLLEGLFKEENLQLRSHSCTASWVKLWMSEANRCRLLSPVAKRRLWRRSCRRWDWQSRSSRTCTTWYGTVRKLWHGDLFAEWPTLSIVTVSCMVVWGVAVSHFWWEETDRNREFFKHNKTCDRNLSAETTSVGPSTASGASLNHRGRAAKWWRSICWSATRSPAPWVLASANCQTCGSSSSEKPRSRVTLRRCRISGSWSSCTSTKPRSSATLRPCRISGSWRSSPSSTPRSRVTLRRWRISRSWSSSTSAQPTCSGTSPPWRISHRWEITSTSEVRRLPVPKRSRWRRSWWRWDSKNRNSRTCTTW